LNHLTKVFGMK